jgi:nucleoside-diphosphate-sugar epimerase
MPDSVRIYRGDLSAPSNFLPFVDGADILYHCAGEVRDVSRMRSVHIDGTIQLINAARGCIGRWVQLSSVGAYGKRHAGVITEQAELRANGIYEASKVECENLVRMAASNSGFEYTILRPSNVYGMEMISQSIFSLISMIQRRMFFFIGRPGSVANYIHVDNVIDALLLVGKSPCANGQVYNVSDFLLIENLVSHIADELGVQRPWIRLPELPVRKAIKMFELIPRFPLTDKRIDILTQRAIYSNKKIEFELGYRHSISLESGLIEMVKFYLLSTRQFGKKQK